LSWRRAPAALLLALGLALGACANLLGIEEAVEGAGGMPGGDGTGGTTAPMSCAAGGTCSDGATCDGSGLSFDVCR